MRNNSVKLLNLDKWFRKRCRLKYFLSRALAALLFRGATLVEGIMGNTPVKLF